MVAEKHSPADERRAERHWPPNLEKNERISDKKTLSALLKSNSQVRTHSGSVIITIVPGQNWEMAILIKKCAGTAVRRNRIKRKIREAYRRTKPLVTTPFSIIFSVYSYPNSSDLNNLPNILFSTMKK
ncbi:ribonuclease P protein component [bacterium]|nr:ribonuclease P protein component [bacterium]MBU1066040.1 ribonuclease P protein component [bacterium]MBU1633092.1 ribonuclease P protein component [bacterium]MBU1874288.1 ribonuclease P protein component [bacterium]